MNRRERARRTIDALREIIPQPETELSYENPYELIVAVILSAQCTDERVNKISPPFFDAFPDVRALAAAEPTDVYPYVKSVTFPNNKSKHLVNMARRVVAEYGGAIPDTVDELMKLPGVGRKSAQVVASVAFNRDALPVDTHVFRVANRIGLTHRADTPLKVELQLKRILDRKDWSEAHHLLILHGRYNCTARSPVCGACPVAPFCLYRLRLERLPAPLTGLDPRKGRYFCRTRWHYFDEPDRQSDRYGVEQVCCPRCGSMNVFTTRTGRTTKRAQDFRV